MTGHDATVDVLELAIPLRLGVETARGPLIVPLWFVVEGDTLWCASQGDSLVVRALSATPRCAFDLSTNDMPYRGLRGRAVARCDAERGGEMLERLLLRYLGSLQTPLARRLLARRASEVAIALSPTWETRWDFTQRMQNSLPPKP